MAPRKNRLKPKDLGDPTAINLSAQLMTCLANSWGTDGDSPAWNDIELVVKRFYEELQNAERIDDYELIFRWNHLLMAVGNFKRQGGTKIWPAPIPDRSGSRPQIPNQMTIPHNGLLLRRDEHPVAGVGPSWKNLQRIGGIGVPTASTLLSALWAGHHIILDIRDVRASVGLVAGPRWMNVPEDKFDLPEEWSWDWYEWLRGCAVLTAERDGSTIVQVERALFMVDRLVFESLESTHGEGEWLWSQYQPEAVRVATAECG